MTSVLVAFASRHGATRGVAEKIGAILKDAGLEVTVAPAATVRDVAGFDAVIAGSGIYAGNWLRPALAFVQRFAGQLPEGRTWAFSCGPVGRPLMPAGRPKAADAAAARAGARENKLFGGVIDRSVLTLPERIMMRAMKVPDGDYRTWEAIETWAQSIAAQLAPGRAGQGDLAGFFALHTGTAPLQGGGTCELSVHDLGSLRVFSGQLEACDPYVNLGEEHAFVVAVAPGEYPVRLTLADVSEAHDGSHLREAYLTVELGEGDPAALEQIVPDGRPAPPAGEYYGVPVDSGTVAFVDHVAARTAMPEDPGRWYEDLFDSGEPGSWFAIMDTPGDLREGSANIVLPRARRGENVVLTHSGWGDGFYPVYRTLDADGEVLGVHIDLQVAGAGED